MSVHFPWDGPSLIRCPVLNQKRTSSDCLQVRHQERRPHWRERSPMAASGSSATWLGGVGRVKDTARLFTKAEQIETRRVQWACLLPGGLKPRRVDSTRGTIHLLFTSTILNTSYCTILCIFTVVLKCFELVQCVFCITFSKRTHVFFYWENIPGQFSIIV